MTVRPSRAWLLIVLASVLPACNADRPNAAPSDTAPSSVSAAPGEVVVVAQGIGTDPAIGSDDEETEGQFVWATAIFRNTTDRSFGVLAEFQVLDDQGRDLGEPETNAAPYLQAGQKAAAGVRISVPYDSTPTSVRVHVQRDEADPPVGDRNGKSLAFGPLTVTEQPRASNDPSEYVFVADASGALRSTYDRTVPRALLTVVCFDARGRVNGGGDLVVTNVAPGVARTEVVESLLTTGEPSRCDGYAVPSRVI